MKYLTKSWDPKNEFSLFNAFNYIYLLINYFFFHLVISVVSAYSYIFFVQCKIVNIVIVII